MYTTTFTAALFAALPAVVSAGNAIVNNYCSQDVYLWSIDNTNYSPTMHTIPQGGQYSEPYRAPPTGGVSIKMATESDLYKTPIVAQFEYTLTDTIWYDISIIDGNPFTAGGLNLIPSIASCPHRYCAAGQTHCADAYNVWNDDHATSACAASADTTFNLCPAQEGSSAPAAAPAPAPVVEKVVEPQAPAPTPAAVAAPATTPAPNMEEVVITADGHPDWVWTTFFTKVVTVYARDAAPNAEPTAAPAAAPEEAADKKAKRHAHPHHGHRHGAEQE